MPRRALIQLHIVNRNNLLRNNNNDIRYPLIHMRDHLFHAAFVRLALLYARFVSPRGRKALEVLVLALSFLSLILLTYIHLAFVQTPTDCLEHLQDKWPRDGILRVEILKDKLNGDYTLEKSYLRERKIKELEYYDLYYFLYENGFKDEEDEDYKSLLEMPGAINEGKNSTSYPKSFADSGSSFNRTMIDEKLNNRADNSSPLPILAWTNDEYIIEFSLEYGFLKLGPSVRRQYNISVELVTLNPSTDKCFGGAINNFILHNFFGYDEVLLASLKLLASKEEYKGYVRNVLSDVEFVFINASMDRKSYVTAGFVMMVFTISISILLRYSHHQIFVFIVEFLHMLEFQSSLNFPAGPLLTVILALVGMEAIMSEFFSDTAIAFYVILIVWMADQYDTICCKSPFSKKHWLRFFYLYHFFFYAYSYRFGHNRFLALLTSWLFTLHSMLLFFHRFELPILISPGEPRNNHPGNPPPNPRSRLHEREGQNNNSSSDDASTSHLDPTGGNSPSNSTDPSSTGDMDVANGNTAPSPSGMHSNLMDQQEILYPFSGSKIQPSKVSSPEEMMKPKRKKFKISIKNKSKNMHHHTKTFLRCLFVNLISYLVLILALVILRKSTCVNLFSSVFWKISFLTKILET